MTVFASGQQTASNPAVYQIGVPVGVLLQGYTFGAQAATDLVVGGPAFYADQLGPDTTVQATVTASNVFAGIVMRSNAGAMPFSASYPGFSSTIPLGNQAQIITRGTVPVAIASANESGSVPLVGSILYAMNAGTFQTQTVGGSAPGSAQASNYRVKYVPSTWSAGGLVVVTNIQNVGA